MKIYVLVLFVVFGVISAVFSEEITLLNGEKLEYASRFSHDMKGVTFEVEKGLRFVSWDELSKEDRERLSEGKYAHYLALQQKREQRAIELRKKRVEKRQQEQKLQQKKKKQKQEAQKVAEKPDLESFLGGTPLKHTSVTRSFSGLFDKQGMVWSLSPGEFMDLQEKGMFEWLTHNKKKEARAADDILDFNGIKILEALVRFKEEHIVKVILSVYNRGDAGDISQIVFEEKITAAKNRISEWLGSKGIEIKDYKRTYGARVKRTVWSCKPYQVRLVWSVSSLNASSYTPEYIRLVIQPFDSSFDPHIDSVLQQKNKPKRLSFLDLQSRIKKNRNGDIFLEGIPMVDQGSKGYCAVAATERVLRYYGSNVDQHELAQIAGTSASSGTNPDELLDALRRIAHREEVKVKVHYDFDLKDFIRTIKRYNKLAKKENVAHLSLYRGGVLADFYKDMDVNVLKQVRMKSSADFTRFKEDITSNINVGIPLVWSVVTGKVVEDPGVTSVSGHARLIIGYNPGMKEILYTDTWGAGHEMKEMHVDDAWAITTGLYTIEPSNWHYTSRGKRDSGF